MKEYIRTFVSGYVFSVPAILLVCLVILIAGTCDNSFAECIIILCIVIVFIIGLPWNVVIIYMIYIIFPIILKIEILGELFNSVFRHERILMFPLLISIIASIIGAHINGIRYSESVHNIFCKVLRYLYEQDTDSGHSG